MATRPPASLSEIPAFDRRTNTIWVAGFVGVDVLDADTGVLIEHIDVTSYGFVNSVAIHNGLAAFALEAAGDRRNPGSVVFYDTKTRSPADGVSQVVVGSLPDMLTFTHDGSKLLVARRHAERSRRYKLFPAGSPGQREHHRHGHSNSDRHGRFRPGSGLRK